jgi:hypothetical protein
MTVTEIISEYPSLEEEDVAQALRYTAWASEREAVERGMDGVMTPGLKVLHSPRSHGHVDEELQPASSTVSSSARLAA